MHKITAIIVEDEEASRTTLKNYLQKYCPSVQVEGEASNVEEGFLLITKHSPDLIFLDVEMPYGNAFDLLEKFHEIKFEIIFVTAFSKYAMDAINLSASCYLLKPLDIDGLIEAVNKVSQKLTDKKSLLSSTILLENLSIENKQLKKIVLPMLDGFEVVVLKEVIRLQANDNLTQIYLRDGSNRLISRTLKFYEKMLFEYDFVRIHKSHIVNVNYVKKYKKGKGGEVYLNNNEVLSVSPSRKNSFLEKFTNPI